ncbi:MAG: hypothetical protein RLZZ66_763 [Pseudomonadota bacterium]|jgi:Ca2+-binding RTX toxin-like protein
MASKDKVAPSLMVTTPKKGGNAVAINQNLVLIFNENIQVGTGNILISNGKGDEQTISMDSALNQYAIIGKTLVINPARDLLPNNHYSVKIDSTAIADLSGNYYAGIDKATTFSFDTVDTLPPVLLKSSSTIKQNGIAPSDNIVLTFSEKIQAGKGNITLVAENDVRSLPISDKQITISGNTLTFNPSADFNVNSAYALHLEAGAINDTALKPNAISAIDLSFKTLVNGDKQVPVLQKYSGKGEVSDNLQLIFQEPIKLGKGNFTLDDGTTQIVIAVSDTKQVSIQNNVLTINPSQNLNPEKIYTLISPKGILTDVVGNAFAGVSAKNAFTFDTHDKTSPTLSITDDKSALTNSSILYTFTLSEASNNFTSADILVTGGTKGQFLELSPTIYNLLVTPEIDSLIPVTVNVVAKVFTDLVGNDNVAAQQNSQAVDTVAPTVIISAEKLVSLNSAVTYTFTLSEASQTFSADIITVTGAEKGVFKALNSTIYSLNVLPNANSITPINVEVASGKFTDFAGNGNIASEKASQAVDTLAPTLLNTSPANLSIDVAKNSNIILFFNENITAGSGDFIISNGVDSQTISVKDATQVFINNKVLTLNPTKDLVENTQYNITFAEGVVLDKSGNAFAGLTLPTQFTLKTQPAPTPIKDTAGQTQTFVDKLKAKALDGYLKGATVFADKDGNGIQDPGEASAITDEYGNFELNDPEGSLVLSGGIDLSTGKPFSGTLRAPEGSSVVTPLTTVQQGFIDAGQSPAQAEKSVAKAFGFDSEKLDLTTYDPIAEIVKTGTSSETQSIAAQIMASSAQIANFLVTTSQVLQGAAGGSDNLSQGNASDALIKSLVTAISQAESTGDGKIDLADATLLNTVIVDSAKEVQKNASSEDVPNFDAENFIAKMDKLSATLTEVLKSAADNISAALANSTEGDGLALLGNLDKVSSFVQNDVGQSLQEVADQIDIKNPNEIDALLKAQKDAFTGDAATKAIQDVVVDTLKSVGEVVAADAADAAEQKAIEDARIAAEQAAIEKAAAEQKAIEDARIAAEQAAIEKAAAEQKAIEDARIAAEQAAIEKAAAEQKVIEDARIAAEQAAIEQAAAEQKAFEDARIAAEQAAIEQAAAEQKALNDARIAAEQAAIEKAAAEQKAVNDARIAAEQAAIEKAAAEQKALNEARIAAEQAAIEKAAAEQKAVNDARIAAEQAAIEKAAAEQKALNDARIAAEQAAIERAAAEQKAINDARIAAEKARIADLAARTINGNSGDDNLTGTSGDDTITGSYGDDLLVGGLGNDSLIGGSGADALLGGVGIDTLLGGNDGDRLDGGQGDDIIDGGADGQWGDIVDYRQSSSAVNVTLGEESVTGSANGGDGNDTLINIEHIYDSHSSDNLRGNSQDNVFKLSGGDDTVDGGNGHDVVSYEELQAGIFVDLSTVFVLPNPASIMATPGNSPPDQTADKAIDGNATTKYLNYNKINTGFTVSFPNSSIINAIKLTTAGDSSSWSGRNPTSFSLYGIDASNPTGVLISNQNITLPSTNLTTSDYYNFNNATAYPSYKIIFPTIGTGETADSMQIADVYFYHVSHFYNIEGIHGSYFDDTILLKNGQNGDAFGRKGNDSLVGGNLNDYLVGGSGNDTIKGGDGFDTVSYLDDGFDSAFNPLLTSPSPITNHGVQVDLSTGIATDNWGNTDTLFNIEGVEGSDFNDSLIGSSGSDKIQGGAGDDSISGGAGDDTIDGGENSQWGGDIVSYHNSPSAVSVILVTGAGSVTGGAGNDVLYQIEGVEGSNFNDTLIGGDGSDHIQGGEGSDSISGGAGDDFLSGDRGNDTLEGGDGNDIYLVKEGLTGNDIITDSSGNDEIDFISAEYRIDGSVDTNVYRSENDLVVSFYQLDTLKGSVTIQGQFLSAPVIEKLKDVNKQQLFIFNNSITGTANNDFMVGTSSGDSITGGTAGDDFIFGNQGNDSIDGGDGSDRIQGGDGADSISGELGDDFLSGDKGNDTLMGGEGSDDIEGGDGDDLISGGAGEDFIFGNQGNDSIDGGDDSDRIQGGYGDDSISGELGDDILSGDQGNDTLMGGEGSDDIRGGDGADSISGELGDDILSGDQGNDTLMGGEGSDDVQGGDGDDSMMGGAGSDDIRGGDGADLIFGELGDDFIFGNQGNDSIQGGDGDDSISGGAGDDFIFGNQGNDSIDGGDGSDRLQGGDGLDSISGGIGNDAFVFNLGSQSISSSTVTDVITDFVSKSDKIGFGIPISDIQFVSQTSVVSDLATLLDAFDTIDKTEGKKLFYFGVIDRDGNAGTTNDRDGYLVTENYAGEISNIIQFSGVRSLDSIDIVGL